MVNPNFDHYADMFEHIVTGVTVLSILFGYLYTRKQREADGKKAVEQVNKLATNDVPHLYDESVKTNDHLEKQTVLLANIDRGIAILVDRDRRA
jgi:hypothetical protein